MLRSCASALDPVTPRRAEGMLTASTAPTSPWAPSLTKSLRVISISYFLRRFVADEAQLRGTPLVVRREWLQPAGGVAEEGGVPPGEGVRHVRRAGRRRRARG